MRSALARLDVIPAAAIPPLIECTADANDGLRMNAARALAVLPMPSVIDVMQRLVGDPNARVRLIAAGSVLAVEPGNALAAAVLVESLEDPVCGVRDAARALVRFPERARRAPCVILKSSVGQNGQLELSEVA